MVPEKTDNQPNGDDEESGEDINFTFSDIPVLGKSSNDKREDFDFEDFNDSQAVPKKPKKPFRKDNTDHLTVYKQILKNESEDVPVNDEREKDSLKGKTPVASEEDSFDAPLAEDIRSGQKEAPDEQSLAKRKKLLVVGGTLVVAAVLAGGGFFFFAFGGESADSPPQEKPSTPKPPPEKKDKVKETPPAAKKDSESAVAESVVAESVVAESDKMEKSEEPAEDVDPAEKMTKEALADLREVIKTGEAKLIKKVFLQILDEYPRNASLQLKAQFLLLNKGNLKLVDEIYGTWVKEKPRSYLANYLYAKTLKDPAKAIDYYRSCLIKEPDFVPPYLKVIDFYHQKRDWKKVEKWSGKCLRQAPDLRSVRDLLTLAKLRLGTGEAALLDYEDYLRENGFSPSEIAVRLIKLAQSLEDPAIARKYLNALSFEPKYMGRHRLYSIRQKAIYGGLSEEDFQGLYPQEARMYHILYLLGRGRNKEVMMMPTPPEDFPDFWKVYLDWLRDGNFWEAQARTIMRKRSGDPYDVRRLIASMWLGETSAEKARDKLKLDQVDSEEVPLLCFMLGELYRKKERNRMKANVMFRKTMKYERSPYRFLARRYLKRR